jgi:hypothetical protein
MCAVEIKLFIVVYWIDNDELVLAFPREHAEVIVDYTRRNWILKNGLLGYCKSQTSMSCSRSRKILFLVDNIRPDTRLQNSELNIRRKLTCTPSAAIIKSASTVEPSSNATLFWDMSAEVARAPVLTSVPLANAASSNCC